MPDLWDQLAEIPVPPAPPAPEFDRGIHARINKRLLFTHLAEFVFLTVPYGLWHFAWGMLGSLALTLTGKFPNPPRRDPE